MGTGTGTRGGGKDCLTGTGNESRIPGNEQRYRIRSSLVNMEPDPEPNEWEIPRIPVLRWFG